jgi:hypothetical protein
MLSGEQQRLKGAGLLRTVCKYLPKDTIVVEDMKLKFSFFL